MLTKIDRAVGELGRLAKTPEAATAYIEAIEKKRREECFIRYWEPYDYEKKVFEAFTPDTKILVVCGGNRSGKTTKILVSGVKASKTFFS